MLCYNLHKPSDWLIALSIFFPIPNQLLMATAVSAGQYIAHFQIKKLKKRQIATTHKLARSALTSSLAAKQIVCLQYSYFFSWALHNFEAWKTKRSTTFSEKQVPDKFLTSGSAYRNEPLALFFHLSDQEHQWRTTLPKTLYLHLGCLLRHARSCNDQTPNFLDKLILGFMLFQTIFLSLCEGSDSNHAEIISKVEEVHSGVMGTKDPTSLLRAILYYNGKKLGGQEH